MSRGTSFVAGTQARFATPNDIFVLLFLDSGIKIMNRKLLLVSSSRTHGTGFLEHCRGAIVRHLAGVKRVLFIPFALANFDSYARLCRSALDPLGLQVQSLHQVDDPLAAIAGAEAVFTGGGNTFRLLDTLYRLQLMEPLRGAILAGIPYMGSSAGTNIACPTIRTTNDMPIVEPPSFRALNVVPFQINPHFQDAVPGSTHQGETREQRLAEYLEENDVPVVGIREGCWLCVAGNGCELQGQNGGVLFRKGQPPLPLEIGDRLDELMQA
jgi:dipeptidase E